MLYSTLMLMMSSAFLMLRLSPGGSFPRPLSEAEERRYLEAWLQGDLEARNVLIERNLRLVAHIIKKYYTHYDDTDDLISIGTIGSSRASTPTVRIRACALRPTPASARKTRS